jgi:uncharacterized protein (DUF362 family)
MGDNFSRRDFMKKSAAASAALALAGSATVQAAPAKTLVKVSGPKVAVDMAEAVKKVLEPLGGMGAFVKKGQKVLLKPNMGFATKPQIRATTSPEMVAAVAREVLACSPARVVILDHPMRHPEACLKKNGIQALCSDLDVTVVLPTDGRFFSEISVPRGKVLKKVHVIKEALETDVHICLPLAKSHMAAGYSGGIKGHMGLILDRESFHSHYEMNQAIADLATVLPVRLSILDGLQVMASGGPAGPGELLTANSLIAGTDIVAVDAAGVTLVPLYRRKIKPKQIRHLKLSAKMGLGQLEVPAADFVQIDM